MATVPNNSTEPEESNSPSSPAAPSPTRAAAATPTVHSCPQHRLPTARVTTGGLLLCHCLRCHHNWAARTKTPPKACARCRHAYWNVPRKRSQKMTAEEKKAAKRAKLPHQPQVPSPAPRVVSAEAMSILPPPPGLRPRATYPFPSVLHEQAQSVTQPERTARPQPEPGDPVPNVEDSQEVPVEVPDERFEH